MVYKRYSNPKTLIDDLIENGMFNDFIITLNEQITFEYEFDVWLHKVDDKTFNDWREELHFNANARNIEMDKDELKATVQKSSDILNGFEP